MLFVLPVNGKNGISIYRIHCYKLPLSFVAFLLFICGDSITQVNKAFLALRDAKDQRVTEVSRYYFTLTSGKMFQSFI